MKINGNAFNTFRSADITEPTSITAPNSDLTCPSRGGIQGSGLLDSNGAQSRLQPLQPHAFALLKNGAITALDQYKPPIPAKSSKRSLGQPIELQPPVNDSGRGEAMPAELRRADTVEGLKQQRFDQNNLPASGGSKHPGVEDPGVQNKLRKAPAINSIDKKTISAPQLQSSTVLLDTLKTITAEPYNNRSHLSSWLHLDSKPASKIDNQDISSPTDLIGSRDLTDIPGTPAGQFKTSRPAPQPPKRNIKPPEAERSAPPPNMRDSGADRQLGEQQLARQSYLYRNMSAWSVDTADTKLGILDTFGQFFKNLTAGFKKPLKHGGREN